MIPRPLSRALSTRDKLNFKLIVTLKPYKNKVKFAWAISAAVKGL
jgi:hypothetical protein